MKVERGRVRRGLPPGHHPSYLAFAYRIEVNWIIIATTIISSLDTTRTGEETRCTYLLPSSCGRIRNGSVLPGNAYRSSARAWCRISMIAASFPLNSPICFLDEELVLNRQPRRKACHGEPCRIVGAQHRPNSHC